MRSKTILAAALAGALAAPLAALADDNSSSSYGSQGPSASANVGGASVQGSLGSSDRSTDTYGQERNDRYAQNDDRDNGRHRGRDKDRDHDKDRHASNQQYGSSSSGQYAQNPSEGSSSPYGSTGDPNTRQS
ncbi:MAG TPA: hypothetical protein VFB01_14525 [Burkholderiales bacterium]|nr:hypothetical protein [Burkholderiales bacterium]